ncbi:TraM recognition domain-containing protein [Nocardia sp. NPDC051832]|uniref:TraM recognition domain-containing protein n=1 Tax=Nocardia sp. NPDC051832 TaxID=3155673 RepID=UPI003432B6C4
MARVRRKRDLETKILVRLTLCGGLVLGGLALAMHLANARAATRQHIPANPITMVRELVRGQLDWPAPATTIVLIELAVLAFVALLLRIVLKWRARGRLAIDDKAWFMATGKELLPVTEEYARERAEALGMRLGRGDAPGIPIGAAVAGGRTLYGTYQDLHLDIWGPSQGKTTARVIPAILTAIGPVLVTSSKREVVDATCDVRAQKGSPVFIFDPQGIAHGSANSSEDATRHWFWDPLAWVDVRQSGCELRAARLAGHFADAEAGTAARGYFEIEAEDLLAGLFLAAAAGSRPITQVWEWVTNARDTEPIELLRYAELHRAASALAASYHLDIRQQSGIFGTAKQMLRCLQYPEFHPWVTRGEDRRQFDELEFLESNGTLYSLSIEERGSAAPLVSALIEAVLDVADRRASRSAGGRLAIPLLAVLDDAANVVRWHDFPQRYSRYASRGIILMTMLQSWAQGVRRWGPDGMNELWSAATIKVLGGGVDDVPFLRDRVEGIGSHEVQSRSMNLSTRGLGYSTSISSENTLGVAELRALPRGRAVLFAAGVPPALIRTVPWWDGEYAGAVRDSLEARGPFRTRATIADLIGSSSLTKSSAAAEPSRIEEVRPL